MNVRSLSIALAVSVVLAGCGSRSEPVNEGAEKAGTPSAAPDSAAAIPVDPAAPGDTGHSASAGKQIYTCSMDPEIALTEPGNCPKCGMVLIKKK